MAKPAEKPSSPLSVPQSGSRPARTFCNMRTASTSMMSLAEFGVRESVPAVFISATCHWILISALTNTADHLDFLRAITVFWSPPLSPPKARTINTVGCRNQNSDSQGPAGLLQLIFDGKERVLGIRGTVGLGPCADETLTCAVKGPHAGGPGRLAGDELPAASLLPEGEKR